MDYTTIDIAPELAESLALQHYSIKGKAKKLPGEVDFNFHLKADDGQAYTLKISRPNADITAILFQHAVISHLQASNFPLQLPSLVLTTGGAEYITIEETRVLRLHHWVDGRMVSEVSPRSPQLLEEWGKTCGLLSHHLSSFDHPAAHRPYKWNPSEALKSRAYRAYIQDKNKLALADYFWDLFETQTLPALASLRKSINYNDAHEHNLLTSFEGPYAHISGIIDFGDALYTETINELAIACAYACMYFPDPLEAAIHLIGAYHEVFPLEEKELSVLYSLIGARLVISVAISAWNQHQEPENKYLSISSVPGWELLEKWKNISPAFADYRFRQACGFEPCSLNPVFQQWLQENSSGLAPIVKIKDEKIAVLDLSIESLDLGNNSNFSNIGVFQKTINRLLEDKGATIGIGGYKEVRPFYTTDAYQIEGNDGSKWRTTHMGIDVWAEAGTPVYAPLDGKVHSFQNNKQDKDYGPTIILEHPIDEHLSFCTLYGHLSTDTLEKLAPGMPIKKGQQIATIGAPPENGDWPPHLHFQLILDMLGKEGDFPGVVFPNETDTWNSILPDPTPFFAGLLKTNKHKKTVDEILISRQQKLGKSLSVSYERPLHMVRAHMQYLYDVQGQRYLDTLNNVPHVGHQHPRVVRAAQRQIGVLNTNTRYLHENIIDFAEQLLATFPPELCVVHFVNSGSEANELALRMAESYTGQKDMAAVEVGYHGNTGGCIAISSYKFDGKGGKGAPPYTHIVPIPDTYRGLYRDPKDAGDKYATHIQQAIEKVQAQGRNIRGFICESILSCGGQIVLPEGYLKKAYQYIREAGGICIADEVQVGFGRVGDKFWGFELQDVIPDIVTMGKPIGNGHPLAAVVTTRAVADAFANGMEYFNTFGGNPVSCAIGLEVLNIIREEGLQNHALEVGQYLIEGLKRLQAQFPLIGDVRGHGLFLGFELIRDQETLEAGDKEAAYLANRMRERGILMSTDGPLHNVLKIKPPMCFDKSNADFLLNNLKQVLSEDFLSIP